MYEELQDWYVSYCHDEYDSDEDESKAEFDHAYETGRELGVMYTTFDAEDGEHDLQVSITLNPAEETVYVDNERVFNHRFESLSDLYDGFRGTDFNDIYSWAMRYHVKED